MEGLGLRKKLGVSLSAILLSACLLLAGCGGASYEGTWYCIKNNGELETLTLDKNGSCYFNDGHAFEWKEVDGGFTVSSGVFSGTYLENGDGTVTTVGESDSQTYYRDQSKAQEVFDGKVAEVEAQKDAYMESAPSQLVGTWYGDKEPSAYLKQEYPEIGNDTFTVTFEEDGTVKCSRTFYKTVLALFENGVEEKSSEETGTWAINYFESENDKTVFKESSVYFEMKMVNQEGQRYAGLQVEINKDDSSVFVTADNTTKLEKR